MAKKQAALKVVDGSPEEPERIDEVSLRFLRAAHQSLVIAAAEHAAAEAHFRRTEKQVMESHGLKDGDGLELEEGRITRKSVKKP